MKPIAYLLLAGSLALQPVIGQYVLFEDNFESADPAGPAGSPPLGNELLVGANIFTNANEYLPIGYFGFDAPNISGDGANFCNVAVEQGGPVQGAQVLAVFSDYNNAAAHTAGGETSPGSGVYTGGQLIDANVYWPYEIQEADLGTTVTFKFDAKFGDFQTGPVLGSASAPGSEDPFIAEAQVFLKVLDPDDGFATLGEDALDATEFPTTWSNDNILTLVIDPSWLGKELQFGFRNKTSNYAPSAIFYDNLLLSSTRAVDQGPKIVSTSWAEEEFFVTFESKDGYDYVLLKGDSLEGPYEEEVAFLDGNGGTMTISDFLASDSSGFYILEEQEPQ